VSASEEKKKKPRQLAASAPLGKKGGQKIQGEKTSISSRNGEKGESLPSTELVLIGIREGKEPILRYRQGEKRESDGPPLT